VNLGHYPTADDVIEVEDRKELERIKKGPDGKGFEMPEDLFKDEVSTTPPACRPYMCYLVITLFFCKI
jgi:hypothetical protein